MKKFDMTRDEDRRAFHAEALELSMRREVSYPKACVLLADRIDFGRRKTFDLSDRQNREALAAEAKKRVELSRLEASLSNVATTTTTTTLEFSDALNAVIADVQAGREIPEGMKAEAES